MKLLIPLLLLFAASCVSKSKYTKDVDFLNDQVSVLKIENQSLESQITNITKDKDGLKKSLMTLREHKQQADKRIADFKELTAKFRNLIGSGKLKVSIVRGRMVVALSSDILFKSGSAQLSSDGVKGIEDVTEILASIEGKSFQVEGHTDNVPIKTARFPSNWELASARALSVVRAMINKGFPESRVSAASFGSTQAVQDNDTESGKALNRRIEIVVVPDLSTLPGSGELERYSK